MSEHKYTDFLEIISDITPLGNSVIMAVIMNTVCNVAILTSEHTVDIKYIVNIACGNVLPIFQKKSAKQTILAFCVN